MQEVYSTIRIQYQDIHGKLIEKNAEGFEAHIIQHEYDHLQGIVYLQRIFHDCSVPQKLLIAALLKKELDSRTNYPTNEEITASDPVLIFDRQDDQVIFQPPALSLILTQLETSTILGMQKCL